MSHRVSHPTTSSGFSAISPNPVVPCTIVSTRPGVTHRKVWSTPPIPGITPGSDANNLNLTFALTDVFGLPTINVAAAPNIDDYIAGVQTGNTAGFAATMDDVWIVTPVGVNSIRVQARTYGVHQFGIYLGKAFQYATRLAWGVPNFTSGDIDLSRFNLLCGQRVIAARFYTCNGYLNYGFYLQVSTNGGATYADIPASWAHGEQPSASSWPN